MRNSNIVLQVWTRKEKSPRGRFLIKNKNSLRFHAAFVARSPRFQAVVRPFILVAILGFDSVADGVVVFDPAAAGFHAVTGLVFPLHPHVVVFAAITEKKASVSSVGEFWAMYWTMYGQQSG